MRPFHRIVLLAVLVAITPVLAGCEDFDPDKFDVFGFNKKKPLPGKREDLFPGGVPGVTQGIPPEYMKGYQEKQQQEAAAAAQAAEAADKAAAEKKTAAAAAEKARAKARPRPKRHIVRRKPKPKPVAAAPAPQPAAQQKALPPWPQNPAPANQTGWPSNGQASQSNQAGWPSSQPQQAPSWPSSGNSSQ
jgi:hypothetical protein